MSDPLFDDVKELLDKEKGDERILKQILRACENNEVISNYERNYVQKLAEKYLGRKPIVVDKPPTPKPITPDVILPPQQPTQPQILQREPTKIKKSAKNSKMYVGIGGAALAVIIITAIASTGLSGSIISSTTDVEKPNTDVKVAGILLETDSSTYQKKDIISINGQSDIIGTINLSIENQDGSLVWSEQLKTKNDGRFSTLVIAAGNGWEKSGTFTLTAENDSEIQTKTFSFKI